MTKKEKVKDKKADSSIDPASFRHRTTGTNASTGNWTSPQEDPHSNNNTPLEDDDYTLRSLIRDAIHDIRIGNLFHTHSAIDLLDFMHEVVALGTVFLVIKLGWQKTIDAPTNPQPLLFALLNFFNIMVYWINVMHGFKFSDFKLTVGQFWFFVSFGVGVTYYPISLDAWIEGNRRELFYLVNIYICFVLFMCYFFPPYKREDVNDLYLAYHRCVCPLALLWYIFVFVLDKVIGFQPAQWLAFAPLIFFTVPLGGPRRQHHADDPLVGGGVGDGEGNIVADIDNNNEHEFPRSSNNNVIITQGKRPSQIQLVVRSTKRLLMSAYQDFQTPGQRLSPFDGARFKNFFNSVTSLAVTFLVFAFSWEYAYNTDNNPKPLLLSIYAYFHVVVYWLGIRHSMAFSPNEFSIGQVWAVTGMVLLLTYYPISLQLWLEKNDTTLYFIISLALCCLIAVFNYITPIDKTKANALFRLFQAYSGIAAVIWYGTAFLLTELGFSKAVSMIYVAPFLYMMPLGTNLVGTTKPVETQVVDREEEVQRLVQQLKLRDAIVENLEYSNRALETQNSHLDDKIAQLESQYAKLRQRRWSR